MQNIFWYIKYRVNDKIWLHKKISNWNHQRKKYNSIPVYIMAVSLESESNKCKEVRKGASGVCIQNSDEMLTLSIKCILCLCCLVWCLVCGGEGIASLWSGSTCCCKDEVTTKQWIKWILIPTITAVAKLLITLNDLSYLGASLVSCFVTTCPTRRCFCCAFRLTLWGWM